MMEKSWKHLKPQALLIRLKLTFNANSDHPRQGEGL